MVPGASPLFAQWAPIASGTSQDLHDIIDFNTGPPLIVVGNQGTILRSTDDGATWTTPASGTVEDLLSVIVLSSAQYWIGGSNGTVLIADDAAQTWHDASPPAVTSGLTVFSRSSGFAYAVGDAGTILKGEADLIGGFNGVMWTTQMSGTSSNLHNGSGFASSLAFVVGDNGTILKTLDGGTTWTPLNSGTANHLYKYIESGNGAMIVVGQDGLILKSIDGGLTWVQKLGGLAQDLLDIDTSGQNANFILAVGTGGLILRSTDNGETWCMQTSGTTADLYGVRMTTNSVHYAVGAGGLILKTTNGGGACTVLPVELSRFEGFVMEGAVLLRWETASETNNSHFEVQHDRGGAFETLAVVPGTGTSQEPRSYEYRVEALEPGLHTFRLRQVDFDGAAVLSDPVTVFLPVSTDLFLSSPSPNPFLEQTAFMVTAAVAQRVRVELFNMLGQRVALLYDAPLAAHQPAHFSLDGAALPSGRYVIRVTGERAVSSRTVVRLK